MKSLATLIKLQKSRVDEQQRFLSKLEEKLEIIENGIAALEVEKVREQLAAEAHPEARMTYGEFLKGAIKRGRSFENERQVMKKSVTEARDKLIELFEEQKRYEIAEDARIEALKKEERRQETSEMDEIGSVQFTRKGDKA